MTRKSSWIGLALAAVAAILVVSADARSQKNEQAERASGPPSLSLTADTTTIRACEDARVRLVATARSVGGGSLRYRWTSTGGKLVGDADEVARDLSGTGGGRR